MVEHNLGTIGTVVRFHSVALGDKMTDKIVDELSKLDAEEFTRVVNKANESRRKAALKKVPESLVDELNRLHKIAYTPINTCVEFSLPVRITTKVGLECHREYGSIDSYDIEIIPDKSRYKDYAVLAAKFRNDFQLMLNESLMDDPSLLNAYDPDIGAAEETKSAQFSEFDNLRFKISKDYDIDAYDLLKDA